MQQIGKDNICDLRHLTIVETWDQNLAPGVVEDLFQKSCWWLYPDDDDEDEDDENGEFSQHQKR